MARLKKEVDSESETEQNTTTIEHRAQKLRSAVPADPNRSPSKAILSPHAAGLTPRTVIVGNRQRNLLNLKDDKSLFRPLPSFAPESRDTSLRSPIRERLGSNISLTPRLISKRQIIGKKINVISLDENEALTPVAEDSIVTTSTTSTEAELDSTLQSTSLADSEKDLEDAVFLSKRLPVTVLSDSEDDVPVKPQSRRRQRSDSIDLAAEMENLQLGHDSTKHSNSDVANQTEVEEVDSSICHDHELDQEGEEDSVERPATPDHLQSPTKSRLKSSFKSQVHIPPMPHARASLDGFWNVQEVNDWNDKHSPKKLLKSPRKNPLALFTNDAANLPNFSSEDEDEEDYPSLRRRPKSSSSSDKENPSKMLKSNGKKSATESTLESTQAPPTPAAASREAKKARKAFDEAKHALAAEFVAELDREMCDNAITNLTQTTGGIRLEWNLRLTKTAGVARNRQRVVDGQKVQECSIELSEKVIDNVDSLRNTLAHEYCHLYNFVIDNERRPKESHGRAFKAIAAQVMEKFARYDVKVTTKHNYEIQYTHEYICIGRRDAESGTWLTTSCRRLEKRHGSGLKMGEFKCKSCHGHVVQVKPQPKGLEEAKDLKSLRRNFDALCQPKKLTAWNQFCKDHQGSVREQLEQTGGKVSLGDVMSELKTRYAALKVQDSDATGTVGSEEVEG